MIYSDIFSNPLQVVKILVMEELDVSSVPLCQPWFRLVAEPTALALNAYDLFCLALNLSVAADG